MARLQSDCSRRLVEVHHHSVKIVIIRPRPPTHTSVLTPLPHLHQLHPHHPSPHSPSSILIPPSPRCSKVKEETATGTSSSTRVRTTLTLAVEGTEFDTAACMLRVKGRNVVENRFVKVGWSTLALAPRWSHHGLCGTLIDCRKLCKECSVHMAKFAQAQNLPMLFQTKPSPSGGGQSMDSPCLISVGVRRRTAYWMERRCGWEEVASTSLAGKYYSL